MIEELRWFWVRKLDAVFETTLLLDTKPGPVVGYKRSKRHSDFAGSASYDHCASRNLKYFGYKLVVLSTLIGIPVVYALVPAHTDEREAAEAVLKYVNGCDILADKGFIGDVTGKLMSLEPRGIGYLPPNEKTSMSKPHRPLCGC